MTEYTGHPRFHELLKQIGELHDKKNKDYAEGGAEGPLGNFVRCSQIKRRYPDFDWTSPFGTAMDFMLKQIDAAFILYNKHGESVTGEPVPSRLLDVAVYALLGIILYETTESKNK